MAEHYSITWNIPYAHIESIWLNKWSLSRTVTFCYTSPKSSATTTTQENNNRIQQPKTNNIFRFAA